MNVLGVTFSGHDSGAALFSNGRVVAIAEERLNRIKYSGGFPALSIAYCLDSFKLTPVDIDLVVVEKTKFSTDEETIAEFRALDSRFGNIAVAGHHDAHAASAFFCSPFQEAAILIYDAIGDQYVDRNGQRVADTQTMYVGRGNRIVEIQKTAHVREGKSFPYSTGIGKLYARISKYVGFRAGEEGKLMGLAAYGDSSILERFPLQMWVKEFKGHVLCNPNVFFPKGRLSDFVTRFRKNKSPLFDVVYLPRPPRRGETLPDDYYSSVAYAVQQTLECVAKMLGRQLREVTNLDNLCIAGGVGLNIDANMNFITDVGFKNVFVQPGSTDTGLPLGCALWGAHQILKIPRSWEMTSASLGREYSEAEILNAFAEENSVSYTQSDNIARDVAKLIADGNIVGWFQGGAEYGPRALGNRSILCDPREAAMRDTVNKKVKHREEWRPFAASILEEHAPQWFHMTVPSRFMLFAAKVRGEKKSLIPAVLHVDDTSRLQTVTEGIYRRLLEEYYELTGVPLVLNTSFNLAGEPIVETPTDALRCFLKTQMDYLALGKYLVQKNNNGRSVVPSSRTTAARNDSRMRMVSSHVTEGAL